MRKFVHKTLCLANQSIQYKITRTVDKATQQRHELIKQVMSISVDV